MSLKIAHLTIYNEPLAVPEGMAIPTTGPSGHSLNESEQIREAFIRGNEAIGISREETLEMFKEIDSMHRRNLEDFFYGWLEGIRTIEFDPSLLDPKFANDRPPKLN